MKSSISSRKRSSPVQRQISATAAGNLTISSVLKKYLTVFVAGSSSRRSLPYQIEPSATTSWTTTPEPVAELVGDVAQRAHVVLDRLELAERHGRVRGVLAVDAEQPRVVREARADPRHARQRALGRPLLALLRPAEVDVLGGLREVGEVLLAPLERLLQRGSPGRRDARVARQRAARGDASPRRSRSGLCVRRANSERASPGEFSEPATAIQSVSEPWPPSWTR